jgi:TetR/AcrR family transcriptional regulator, copper-responsive repressor
MKLVVVARPCQMNYLVIAMNTTAPAKRRGRPRGFNRDKALDCALRLFWDKGFEATSVSDLTKAMQITPPALYSAYGDKKSLFLEAVERYEESVGCFAQKALVEAATAKEAIEQLLRGAVKAFANPAAPKGCLVVLGAINCAAESSDIYLKLAERRRNAEKAVRTRIAAGRLAGELADDADVDALSGMVTATLFGLALKAKDGASRVQLYKTVDQMMRMWPDR